MRSISSALEAAQRSPGTLPYPRVEVFGKVGGITRLDWKLLYEGSEEDFSHACCMPSNGSLIRLRVDPADNKLYRQLVTSPDENSTYSSWTYWGVDACAVALAAYGTNVWAFRIAAGDSHLYRSDSTDSGASWGSWTDMGDVSGDEDSRLGSCAKSATEALLLYSDGSTLYRRRLSGSAWEAAAEWGNSLHSISGVACVYSGDWNIILTGSSGDPAGRPGVWTTLLGDGYSAAPGDWTPLKELIPSHDPDSQTTFSFPALGKPDVYRAAFVESFAGTESYDRPYQSWSPASADFISSLWREPLPLGVIAGEAFESHYGLAICYSNAHAWLTRPDLVSRAPLTPSSVDLTADVAGLKSDIGETGGEISIVLRNDDARYASIGTGDYTAIKPGSEIKFSPGYRTSSGIEVSPGPAFWITGWEYISGDSASGKSPFSKGGFRGINSTFILYASDGWALLDSWKPRRPSGEGWAAGEKNIFQMLAYIFARAGLEFASQSSSADITDQKPAFSIPAGQSGARSVRTLLALVPDAIYFRGHYGYLVHPRTSDTTDYEYGTGHPIWEGNYKTVNRQTNHVHVFGAGLQTDDFHFDELELAGERLTQVHDISLDTVERAHARGESVLRSAELHSRHETVLVPLNCGQELYDVVEITDARAAYDAEKRRCLGLSHMYDTRKGIYSLKIELGAV